MLLKNYLKESKLRSTLRLSNTLKVLLAFLYFSFFSLSAFSEGSNELNTNTGERAYLYSSTASTEGIYFPTQGLVRVYVNSGETIYLGSSAQGYHGGTMYLRSPTGVLIAAGTSNSIGRIENRNQESIGPLPLSGGYTPFKHLANETGVWSVFFVGATSNTNNPGVVTANADWPVTTTLGLTGDASGGIAAFDVSVSTSAAATLSSDFIKGRAYMNVFGGRLWGFSGEFRGKFEVLTNDGYNYNVDANGLAGNAFTFFSNNKGYKKADGTASYLSLNGTSTATLQDPRNADTPNDVTHKLFFNVPDTNLPTTLQPIWMYTGSGINPANNGTAGTTWLKTIPLLPEIKEFKFTGIEGTSNQAGTAPLSGIISFESNQTGTYTITIDVDNNGIDVGDRTLQGNVIKGINTIPWDGRDAFGVIVQGTMNASAVEAVLKAGEVHFPFIDVENNPGGIRITRAGGGIGTTTVYWNDKDIQYDNGNGSGADTESNPITQLTGVDSYANGHKWGTINYNSNDFGDQVGLDTWTYLLSSPLASPASIQLVQADLEVIGITRSNPNLCVGQPQTYTIQVRNNGPHAVTGAKFRFQYPSEFTSVSGTWSDGTLGSASPPPNTYEAIIDLANQEVLTFTVTGTVTGIPTGNNLAVTASILRPADVFDPDATNPDSAAPTDAQLECDAAPSGLGCNNVKTSSTAVISPDISISSTSITEGSTLGTTNMTFTVSLSAVNPACDVTVNYEIPNLPGNTTDINDFNGTTSGTITILRNQPSATITIPIAADKTIENSEIFTIRIFTPTSGQIIVDQAIGTIIDDDNAPVSVVLKNHGSEPGSPARFTIGFPAGVKSSVNSTVTYSVGGNATAGSDYTALSGTVIIPAGVESVDLPEILVIDDTIIEGTETVSITLSGVTSTIATTITPGTAIANIADDDALNNIIILTKGVDAQEPGTHSKFRVSFPLGYTTTVPTTVTYQIGGTATNGADYVALSGTVTILPGNNGADIDVTVSDDLIIEGDETLILSNLTATNALGLPFNYSGVPQTLIIKDNDNISPQLVVTTTDGSEPGTNGRFRISFSNGETSTVPTSITYTLLPGSTATNGTDYATIGTIATIPAGASYVDVIVTVIDDKVIEGPERIDLSIQSATNANAPGLTFSSAASTVGIADDDNTALITLTKVSDGAEPGTVIRYRVNYPLGMTSAQPTIITYSVGGTAGSNSDYTAPSGTVTIDPLTNEAYINIPVLDDNISELTETVTLTITSATNSVAAITFVPNNPVSADILDDENIGPNNVITLFKINDGAEPGTPALFRVKYPGTIVNAAPTTVTYVITGTAVNGTDYTTLTGTIVIPANVNGVDIPVGIIDDKIIEGTETIALQLTSAVNTVSPGLTVNPGTVVADLGDDDNATPNNIVTLSRVQDGFEGGAAAQYKVSFPFGITSSVNTIVSYSVSGTAINGTDYGTLNGTVTIFAGDNSAFITLPVVDDLIIEGTETVSIIPTSASNAVALLSVAPNTAVNVDIFDNDNNSPNVALSLIRNGAEGGVNPQYRVSFPLNVTSSVDTKLSYFISGTATNGTDYNVLNGTVTIPAGVNFADIDIIVNDDLIIEGNETVALTLTGIENAVAPSMTFSPGTTLTATIADNDNVAPNNVVRLTLVQHGAEGGSIPRFEVSFPSGITSSGETIVNYSIGGSALNGTDYTSLTGTVTIPAGQNSVFIDAPVVDDLIIEGIETLALTLTSATTTCACPLAIQPGAAVIANIGDNDNGGSTITLRRVNDGAEPGTNARFEVSLPAGMTSSYNTTVNYTLGGTAINGTDYNNLLGSVVILAGERTAFIDVVVKDDYIIEGNETVSVTLLNASNPIPASSFSVSPTTAVTALIVDNDNATPNNVVTLTRIQHGAENPLTSVIFRVGFPNAPNTLTSSAATLVSYSVSGSALGGTDYGILPGTITIPAGANYADIIVPVIDDKIIEGLETVELTLNWATNPVAGLTVFPGSAVSANIVDDEDINATVFLTKMNDGSEPSTHGQFKVGFANGVSSSEETVITYTIVPAGAGVATPTSDYQPLSGTVTIPAGDNYALIDVIVKDDLTIEGTETVGITLSSVTNSAASILRNPLTPVTLDILDDELDVGNPANVITLTKVSDGREPGTSAFFKVSYPPGVSAVDATVVNYSVGLPGTGVADPGDDYEPLSGTVTIPAGSNSALIEVKVKDDQIFEYSETVSLRLTGADNGTGTPLNLSPVSDVVAYIDDEDDVPPYNLISVKRVDHASEPTTDGKFEIGFPDGYTSSEPTTVTYTITGTALNTTDYQTITGSVLIPANTNWVPVLVDVNDDFIIEGPETVILTIISTSNPISNPQILPGNGTVIIADDDNTVTNNTISLSRLNNGSEPATDPRFSVSFPIGITTTVDTYVNYTIGGTATNGVDYTTVTGVAIIPAGQSSAEILIDVINDNIIEGTENVVLTLTSASNALVNSLAVLNAPIDADIDDDDNTGPIELIAESSGTEPGTRARFRVQYPAGKTRSIESVLGYIIGGTAAADVDYRALSGTVRIPAGQEFAYIDAEVIDDLLIEPTETVSLNLNSVNSAATDGVTINSSVATANIEDNDFAGASVILTKVSDASEPGTNAVYRVSYSNGLSSSTATTVTYTSAGSATSGSDYTALSHTVTIPAEKNFVEFSVNVIDDKIIEPTEQISLSLATANNGIAAIIVPATLVTANIYDDDILSKITIKHTDDGMEPNDPGLFRIGFEGIVTSLVDTRVNYVISGTALNGTDYTLISGFTDILAGQNYRDVIVDVQDDKIIEGTETVILTITSATSTIVNPDIVNGTKTVNILDDDNTPLHNTVTLSLVNHGSEPGTKAQFKVSLPELPAALTTTSDTWINYTIGGTATNGLDYEVLNGVAIIPAGSTFTLIDVIVKDDKIIEGTETVQLKLVTAQNDLIPSLTVAPGSVVTANIDDDDDIAPFTILSLSKEADAQEPGNPGRIKVSFPTGYSSSRPTEVNYSVGGTAAHNVDYETLNGKVTIPADENFAYIDIDVIDDQIVEGDETVEITVTSITNIAVPGLLTVSPTSITANIRDDDYATLSISSPVTITEGNGGPQLMTFTVTLSKETQHGFQLRYNTADGSAISTGPRNDFDAVSGGLVVFPGESIPPALPVLSKTFTIPIIGDKVIERDEDFQVVFEDLIDDMGGHLSFVNKTATGIIEDDDNTVDNKKLTISKTDGHETPGNDGQFTISFPAGVSADVPTDIQYTLTGTARGSLATDKDYNIIQTGTITIPAYANSSAPLVIPVFDDTLIELTETVILNTEPPVNIRYGDIVIENNGLSLDIVDNDNAILTISGPITHNEGDLGPTTYTYTVTLNRATEDTFDVNYTTKDGTAKVADNDYSASSGTLTFGSTGPLSRDIIVVVNGDKKIESNETFTIELSPTSGTQILGGLVQIAGSPAQGIITDDDNTVDNKKITIIATNGAEGGAPGRVRFSLPDGVSTDGTITIPYTFTGTAKGSGWTDYDYNTVQSATVTIPADSTGVTIELPVNDDSLIEGDETVVVNASPITHDKYTGFSLDNAPQIVTIADNDNTLISIAGPAAAVLEGHSSTKTAVFTVTLNKATAHGFSVDYKTIDGTATSGDPDYDAITGQLHFAAGETSKTIEVTIRGDEVIERDETFQVELSNILPAFGGQISFSNTTATGTITDDDNNVTNKKLTISKTDGNETPGNDGQFTISFPSGISSDVATTIQYTLTGTAKGLPDANKDYNITQTGTITIPAYANSSAPLVIPVFDDSLIELTETVIMNAEAPVNSRYSGISIDNNGLSLNIVDNDNATLTISGPVTHNEGNLGTTTYTYTVTLDKEVGDTFDVNYTTKDGTATVADSDYSASSGSLTFGGGVLSRDIIVVVNGDKKIESNETFTIELSPTSGTQILGGLVQIAGSPAQGIITDDDNTVDNKKLTITTSNGAEGGANARVRFSFPAGVSTDGTTSIPYTFGGTAKAAGSTDYDYNTLSTATVIIPADSTDVTIELPVNDDVLIEGDETVIVTASPISHDKYTGFTVDNAPQTLTILDNDGSTLRIEGPVFPVDEGHDGFQKAIFAVKLSGSTGGGFNIRYGTVDGTARVADNDYVVHTNQLLTFDGNHVGEEVKYIEVLIRGDRKIERDEDFQVKLDITTLSNDFGGRLTFDNTSATGTIKDDDNTDANKEITITGFDGTEGAANGSFVFMLPENVVFDTPTIINYSISGGVARPGVDYSTPTVGSVTIAANSNFATLPITVINDALLESSETVILTAGAVNNSNYGGITVVNSPATLFIHDNDVATLSINGPITVTEGNTGLRTAVFRVSLSAVISEPFEVNYKTVDGTATLADKDYRSTSGKLSFVPGVSNQFYNISVPIEGDLKIEQDEIFTVELFDFSTDFDSRLSITGSPAEGRIRDDDNTVTNKRIIVTRVLGEEGGNNAQFKFSFPPSVTADDWTTISYTLSGSALPNGGDYSESAVGYVTISEGENNVTLTLNVVDDKVIEQLENVTLTITSIENTSYPGITSNSPVSLTIKDNDTGELILSGPVVVTEGNSGPTLATFTVTSTAAVEGGFDIGYRTLDGTATVSDNDYVAKTANLRFDGDEGEIKEIIILVNGDKKIEGHEDFYVRLQNLSNSFGGKLQFSTTPSQGRIINDDNGTIIITKVDGKEGVIGGGSFIFSLTPGVYSDKPIIIPYTLSGSATPGGVDYRASGNSSVTIPAFQSSYKLNLLVLDDDIIERRETVKLSTGIVLSSRPNDILVENSPQELIIDDNDSAPIVITNPIIKKEGHNGYTTAEFTVTVPLRTDTLFTLEYATEDGTALIADNDYLSKSGTLFFSGKVAGDVQVIKVLLKGDVKVEGDEDYFIKFTNQSNDFEGRLLPDFTTVKGVIHDDDIAPVAQSDIVTTPEDTPITFSLVVNDTDLDGIDPTAITIKIPPTKGTVKVHQDGTVTYTPELNDNGRYTFSYTVKDITGLESNEANVTVIITPVNDPPHAEDDKYFALKGGSLREDVSVNDIDVDGDIVRFKVIIPPTKGTIVSFNEADGTFIYAPFANALTGIDEFVYQIIDASGLSDTATVFIGVQPKTIVKLNPTLVTLKEGETVNITAVLSEPLLQDVDVILEYNGDAELEADYNLGGDVVSFTIKAGDTTTVQQLILSTVRDYRKETDEVVEVNIASATPTQFVEIESGSEITITELTPEDRPVGPDENADINPDPYASPDGDGLGNESFVIHNIDKYPDNEVAIFNRWGNEVFRIKGYNNKDKSFVGVANKGLLANSNSTLPDGVYYFIIYTKVENVTKMNKGYVIIKR